MKQILFQDKPYMVPDFVSWIVRHRDGAIVGYQWEPFPIYGEGNETVDYRRFSGQYVVIESPVATRAIMKRV